MAAVDGNSQDTTILCTMPQLIQTPGIYLSTTIAHLVITGHVLMKVHRFSKTTTTGLGSTHTTGNVAGMDTDTPIVITVMAQSVTTSGFVTHHPPMPTSTLVTMKSIQWNTRLTKATLRAPFA